MSDQPKLKDQNLNTLRVFVGGVVAAYVAARLGVNFLSSGQAVTSYASLLDPTCTGLAAIGGVFSLLLLNLIPTPVKDKLVHWRRRDVLPAHRAFSEIGPQDSRVDLEHIAARRGALPTDPVAQNKLWFKIYKANETSPGVENAHKSYLLYRELASVALLLLVLLVVVTALAFRMPSSVEVIFCGLLVGVYVLAATSARNTGARFVSNVLAAESAAALTRNGGDAPAMGG